MKISKSMLLGGALTLVVGSLFATKTSKKFAAVATAFVGGGFNRLIAIKFTAPHLTSVTTNGGKTAFFSTVGGTKGTLFTAASGINKAYYK